MASGKGLEESSPLAQNLLAKVIALELRCTTPSPGQEAMEKLNYM
jgi:hypothetical protein